VQRAEIDRLFGFRLDAELDQAYGCCRLRAFGQIVVDALRFFDTERYQLFSYAVMPNHVHVIASLQQPLEKILHSWKSYTAHQARERFWEREYYDHLIRDERELDATITYVRGNPAKAGLVNWPWVF